MALIINGTYIHQTSTVAGRQPATTDVDVGEIAINAVDGVLFTKNSSGVVIALNNSYSKAEADARYVPQGILPITRVGTLDANPLPVALSAGFTFTVSTAIPVMISGRYMTIAAGNYTISNVDNGTTTDLTNKTINVYITMQDGAAVFAYYTTAQAEAYALVFIGTITTVSAITALNLSKVSRLDLYRVSLTSKGSAIPVTSGTPNTTGTFDPSWNI